MLLDDTAHVMLRCTAHVVERKIMEDIVDRELQEIAASNPAHRAKSLATFGTDTMKLRLLLGSPQQHLREGNARYGRILAASASFIAAVHRKRWLER